MGRVSGRNHGWIDRFVAEDGTSSNNIQLSSKVAAGVGISGCLLPFFLNSIDGPTTVTAATAVPFFDVQGDHDSRVYPFLSAFTSRYLVHLGVHLEVLLRGRTGWLLVTRCQNRTPHSAPSPRPLSCCVFVGSRAGWWPRALDGRDQAVRGPGLQFGTPAAYHPLTSVPYLRPGPRRALRPPILAFLSEAMPLKVGTACER